MGYGFMGIGNENLKTVGVEILPVFPIFARISAF